MQTIRIEITGEESLEELRKLEENKLIRILNEPDINSYSLPGEAISENEFKNWIEYAEESPTIDFYKAKEKWENQKKKLKKIYFKNFRKCPSDH